MAIRRPAAGAAKARFDPLPAHLRVGVFGQTDWRLTMIVAVSFLVHFGLVGAMYSDWADPVLDEQITTGGLVDMMKALPPERVELPPTPVEDTTPRAPREGSPMSETSPRVAPRSAASRASTGAHTTAATNERAEEARLAAQASAMHFELVGARVTGTAVDRALRRLDAPAANLEQAAASAQGADHRTDSLRMATGEAPIRPGLAGYPLRSLAAIHERSDNGPGREAPTRGPAATNVIFEPAEWPVPDAERVIAAMRPGFRVCFSRGLAEDPHMAGRVSLIATIASNGEVSAVDIDNRTGVSEAVTACLARRVRGAHFDRQNRSGLKNPNPGGAGVSGPLERFPQARKQRPSVDAGARRDA